MLKRVLDSLDDLDESLRGLYVEQADGSYRLDAEPDDGAELKRALERSRTEAKQLKVQLSKFDGVDADEYTRLSQRVVELEALKGKRDDDYEKLKEQLAEKYTGQLDKLKQQTAELTTQLHTRALEAEASAAVAQHKGVPELLMPFIRERAKVVGENGEAAIRVFDEKGVERLSPRSGVDAPMSVAELVEEMKSDSQFSRLFDGSGGSGGGAPPNSSGGAGVVRTRKDLKTDADEAAFIREKGADAFLNLPSE